MPAVTIYDLEMTSPAQFCSKANPNLDFEVRECGVRVAELHQFMYRYVGQAWQWTDKNSWSASQWQDYAANPNLRLWLAYYKQTPAGYFELEKRGSSVEILYFGLAPVFTGLGLGGYFLSEAIQQAWLMQPERVIVNTCSLDHPAALKNYQARGMRLIRTRQA